MKKMNVVMMLGVLCVMGQVYGKISPKLQNKWKADIRKIITNNAVNTNGKMEDMVVVNKVMDYKMNVIIATKQIEKDEVQAMLNTLVDQRLQEIKATKSKNVVVGKKTQQPSQASQQPQDKWRADIRQIITDNAVNANGKIIDTDVVNRLLDHNVGVMSNTKPADKDAVQAVLDAILVQRLQEIKAAK